MPSTLLLVSVSAWLALAPASPDYPPHRFDDPNRRTTLEKSLDGIEPVIREQMDRMRAPGLSWGIIIDGELARAGGMGVREVGSTASVDLETVFRIASMTKSFTALAILQLRDEGKLSLDDPVKRHIPEFSAVRLPTADSPAITIRHLLTHSEGLPEDNPWGDRQLAISDEAVGAWLGKGLPFSTPPATAYEYSNYGFALLGRIVANVSGVPYREYVSTRILRPLGMTATSYEPQEVPNARAATGYRPVAVGWEREPSLPYGAFGAMGGLLSSGRDLARYVAFMLSAWPPRDDEDPGPVKRSSLREMQQGQRFSAFSVGRPAPDAPVSGITRAYAYGLSASRDCRFAQVVSHGGGLPGFGSYMTWLPEYGVGVVVLANVTYAPAAGVTRVILDRLAASGALRPRRIVPSAALLRAHEGVAALIDTWSDDLLKALAADNLFLDRTLEVRRREFAAVRERVGACAAATGIDAENWLRGTARLSCERGTVAVDITLAPTQPPLVQYLDLVAAQPLEAPLAGLLRNLAALVSEWDDATAAAVVAPEMVASLRSQSEGIRASYGACRAGDVLSGDGRSDARVRLACDRGPLDVHVEADAASARVRTATFTAPMTETCVP